jgi:hypothetical protein
VNASRASFRRLATPAGIAAITLVVASLIVIGRLSTFSWDPSRFVLAGEGLSDPSRVPANIHVIRGAYGYDGQAYYRLALDPFTDKKVDHGITLDSPAYRQQRIGYPLLAWAVSLGGRTTIVPWALIGINVLALAAIAWFGASIAQEFGRSALWGALFPVFPGFVVSLARDLVEPLAIAFLLCGILLLTRKRSTWGALFLTAGVLTRETTLLVPVGLAIAFLVPRTVIHEERRPAREFVLPAAVFVAWQLFLYARWHHLPILNNPNATDPPFVGFSRGLSDFISARGYLSVIEMTLLVTFAVLVLTMIRKPPAAASLRAAALLAVILVIVLDHTVWEDHAHFLRAFTETYVLGTLVAMRSLTNRAMARMATLVTAIWIPVVALFIRRL